MTNNDKFIECIDKATAIAKKHNHTDVIAWAKKALADREITQADYDIYEKIHNIRNFMALGNADDIQIPEKNLIAAEGLYKAICQWDGKIAAQENAPAKQLTYIKEGDYVLIYGKVAYGSFDSLQGFRLRYDVFKVVKNLKLQPLYDYRFQKWEAAPISQWFPKGVDNVVVLVIPGGLPKNYLLERHSHIWSSNDRGMVKEIDGKREIFLAEDTYNEKTGKRNFRQVLCQARWVSTACFDPEKPLAIEEQREYIVKHYGGQYYMNVPWGIEDWKHFPCKLRTIQ